MKFIVLCLAVCAVVSGQECTDKTQANGLPWNDNGGIDYNCKDHYSIAGKCEADGDSYENFGFTANQACCVCGGGNRPTRPPSPAAPTMAAVAPTMASAPTSAPVDKPDKPDKPYDDEGCSDYMKAFCEANNLKMCDEFLTMALCGAHDAMQSARENGMLNHEERPCSKDAKYMIYWDFWWEYPGGRFSPPQTYFHAPGSSHIVPGQAASPGLKNIAETGNPTVWQSEVQAAGYEVVSAASGPVGGKESAGTMAMAMADHTEVTGAAMIAPSPDWFVGFAGVNLCYDGMWVKQLSVPLQPMDAGTDSGRDFKSDDVPTTPAGVVTRIKGQQFDALFDGLALGTATFTMV